MAIQPQFYFIFIYLFDRLLSLKNCDEAYKTKKRTRACINSTKYRE